MRGLHEYVGKCILNEVKFDGWNAMEWSVKQEKLQIVTSRKERSSEECNGCGTGECFDRLEDKTRLD